MSTKIFVHRIKRAELRAIENPPHPEPQPVFVPIPPKPEVIEIEVEGVKVKAPRKELESMVRWAIKHTKQEIAAKKEEKRRFAMGMVNVKIYNFKQIRALLETYMSSEIMAHEENIVDIELDTMYQYLGDVVEGWNPSCLYCETRFFRAMKYRSLDLLVSFHLNTGEDLGTLTKDAKGAKDLWLVSGVCRRCKNKTDQIHKRRFATLMMGKENQISNWFIGLMDTDSGRKIVGGKKLSRNDKLG